jgi:hypothetical protein
MCDINVGGTKLILGLFFVCVCNCLLNCAKLTYMQGTWIFKFPTWMMSFFGIVTF